MTPERWREVEALFEAVVDLPAAEREAILHATEDPSLRAEVESLLRAVPGAPEQLEQVIAAQAKRMAGPSLRGAGIGPYRLLEELGEGGMGVVWLAERDDGQYRTRVAIKLLHGHGSEDAIARFRDERQILAGLEHPGIVRLLDGGSSESGEPYLVMEYVAGVPITRYAAEHELSLSARLELFGKVAAAVAFAHQHLIVHRDLKPSNILVTKAGVPKLLDFGIAKLLDSKAAREAETRTGRQLLTPEYASPEQIRGEPITTATDIYSLGVVLYELCTDAKAQPLLPDDLATSLRTVVELEPRRPSLVAPAPRRRALRGDLDNIILKAMHKQVDRRYASVEQLVEDLERWAAGLPVRARPATLSYRAGKFLRRNAVAVGLGTIAIAALAGMTRASLEQARRADEQAREAETALALADEQAARANEQADLARVQARTARDAMRVGAAQRAMQVDDDPTLAILLLRELESDDPAGAFGWLAAVPHFTRPAFVSTHRFEGEQASVGEWSPDGSRVALAWFDAGLRLYAADGRLLVGLDDKLQVRDLAWSPDGTRLLTGSSDGAIRMWQADGKLLGTLDTHDPLAGSGIRVAWSPDGRRFASAGDDGMAVIWDLDGREQARLRAQTSAVTSIVWSPDGTRLATASRWEPNVRVWQLDGTPVATLAGHRGGVHALAWADDDRLLAASDDHVARVWRVDERAAITLAGHDGPIVALALDPTGERVALASTDKRGSIWRLDGTRETVLAGHRAPLSDVRWSDDGTFVATAAEDSSVRVWRPDGVRVGTITPHDGNTTIAWRPHDSKTLLTISRSGAVESWAPERSLPTPLVGHRQVVRAGVWSPDGTKVATASDDGTVRIWARDGTLQTSLRGHAGHVQALAWAEDAGLCSADEHELRMWGSDGHEITSFGPVEAELLAFARGPQLATAHADGSVRLWGSDGQLQQTLTGHEDAVRSLAWSRDGLLATGSWDTTARIWKAGQPIVQLIGHTRPIQAVAWNHDGTLLATTAMDRSARIWRIDGTTVAELPGADAMDLLAWSGDGTRLVTTGNRQARVWSADGTPLARLLGHTGEIVSIAWSSDGSRILTASTDATARLWSADGLLLATLVHDEQLSSAALSPSDDAVLTTSTDGQAMIWPIDAGALLRGFWLSTPRCPEVETRQRLLAEPLGESERAQVRCEAMQACLRERGQEAIEGCLETFRQR